MLPLATLEPGRWYIRITCRRCKIKLPLFEDLNHGNGSVAGNFALRCPECGLEDNCPAEHYFHRLSET